MSRGLGDVYKRQPQISLKLFKRYSCVLFQRKIKPTSVRDELLVYQYVIEMEAWKNKDNHSIYFP